MLGLSMYGVDTQILLLMFEILFLKNFSKREHSWKLTCLVNWGGFFHLEEIEFYLPLWIICDDQRRSMLYTCYNRWMKYSRFVIFLASNTANFVSV